MQSTEEFRQEATRIKDVIANNVEFLGSSQQGTPRQPDEAYSDSAPNYQEELPDGFEATEEDIPF